MDEDGKRYYETGCDKGVLYVCDDTGKYGDGVAWNGLTGVTEVRVELSHQTVCKQW